MDVIPRRWRVRRDTTSTFHRHPWVVARLSGWGSYRVMFRASSHAKAIALIETYEQGEKVADVFHARPRVAPRLEGA